MECCTLLLLFVVVLFTYLSYQWLFKEKNGNLPLGPKGWPILGSLLELTPTSFLAFQNIGKLYGPIFTVNLGWNKVVILNSYEAVKEAMGSQSFTGRSSNSLTKLISRNQGIVFTDGDAWKNNRKNAMRILRNFGFGKQESKDTIHLEIEELITILDSKRGAPIQTESVLLKCTARIILSICINEKPSYDDLEFEKFVLSLQKVLEVKLTYLATVLFPFLLNIPFFIDGIMRFSSIRHVNNCLEYVGKKLEEHKKNLNTEQEPKDYMDALLLAREEAKKLNDYNDKDFEYGVKYSIWELFGDGTHTITSQLVWAFFILALHPEMQERIKIEVDAVCDRHVPIQMEHKKSLPFTCAFLDELMRFSSVAAFGVEHRATENEKLMNFDIPKDTLVMPNFYAVHHDEKYWKRPDEFYPNHFLTEDGKSYQPDEHLIPFSLGPRKCIGEGLGTMEIFLITTSIVRRYSIKCAVQYSDAEIKKMLVGLDFGTRDLQLHELCFTKREQD